MVRNAINKEKYLAAAKPTKIVQPLAHLSQFCSLCSKVSITI